MEEEWTGYDGGEVQEWHWTASQIRVAPDVTVIPQAAFRGCPNLRTVDLGSVTTISTGAFFRSHSLARVVWAAASVVEIGDGAFAQCHSLSEIDLSHATKIGSGAFWGCNSLERVSIPSSVVEIEDGAFQYKERTAPIIQS